MDELVLKIGKFKNLGSTAKTYIIVYTGISSDSIGFSVFLQTLGKVDITFPLEDKILEINDKHFEVVGLDPSQIILKPLEQEKYTREINEKMDLNFTQGPITQAPQQPYTPQSQPPQPNP